MVRQVHLLRDLRAAPVPAVREAPVGGDDQPDRAGGAGPLDPRGDRVAVAQPVDLEEGLGVGGDDLFDRLAGERRQPHRGAAGGGRAGDGHLAVGVHGLHAGRRDQHRQRNVLAHHGCRQIALLGGADDVRGEAELAERLDVVGERQALLAAGEQRGVDRLGQPLLGALAARSATVSNQVSRAMTRPDFRCRAWPAGASSAGVSSDRACTVREWSALGPGLVALARPARARRSPRRIRGRGRPAAGR